MPKQTVPVRLVFEGEVTVDNASSREDAERRVRENWGATLGHVESTDSDIDWDISTHPEKEVGAKNAQTPEFLNRVIDWYAGDDRGVSSETIMSVMLDRQVASSYGPDVPYDRSDFGRCSRLLEKFPEFKERLPEVADKYPEWKPIVDNFDRLNTLHGQDAGNEFYRLIKQLVRPETGHDANPERFQIFTINPNNPDGVAIGNMMSMTSKKDRFAIEAMIEAHPGAGKSGSHITGVFMGVVDKAYESNIADTPGVFMKKGVSLSLVDKILFVAPYPTTIEFDGIQAVIKDRHTATIQATPENKMDGLSV